MRIIILALLSIISINAHAESNPFNTKSIIQDCRLAIEGRRNDTHSMLSTASCYGYIAGWLDGNVSMAGAINSAIRSADTSSKDIVQSKGYQILKIYINNVSNLEFTTCLTTNINAKTIAEILVNFADNHPEKLNSDIAYFLPLALRDTYCPK